jgi:hypothetical protein
MFEQGLRSCLKKGLTGVEVSWLLEDNEPILRIARLWGGEVYKTYRMYERSLKV